MTDLEEKINKWQKVKIAYDVWLQTLPPKYRVGTTIYTQMQQVLNVAVSDFEELNEKPQKPYKENWNPDWEGDPNDPRRWKGW